MLLFWTEGLSCDAPAGSGGEVGAFAYKERREPFGSPAPPAEDSRNARARPSALSAVTKGMVSGPTPIPLRPLGALTPSFLTTETCVRRFACVRTHLPIESCLG